MRAEGDSGPLDGARLRGGGGERDAPARFRLLYVTPAATAGQEEFPFDPATANAFSNAGYWLLVCSTMTGALVALATSIVAYRTGLFPRWLALAGFFVAAALLLAVFYLPLFVWLAWVLAVSLVLLVRTARVTGWRRGAAS